MVIGMPSGLFQPIDPASADAVVIRFDDAEIRGQATDTLLAVLLRHGARVGMSEFDGTPRAGFCLMGSCQECTVWDEEGHRLRACMTEVRDGLSLRSKPYANMPRDE